MIEYYTWIITFHIISFTSWMAMLFYLPRLYVYHIENITKKEYTNIVKIQEYKIYKYIGLPAMIATLISGIVLLYMNHTIIYDGFYMIAKIVVVILLVIYTFSLEYYRKQLLNNICKRSGAFFRAYNELPTLLFIFIVSFIIIKKVSIIFITILLILYIFIIYKIFKSSKNKTNN
jgi:protoporphyrinogen IX oxidase